MNAIRKICSIIFNPFTNLFKINSVKGDKFLGKHHCLLWLISAILIGLLMFVVYYYIYK